MVSVFDGQLSRTWHYDHDNKNHVITLYHDTITGKSIFILLVINFVNINIYFLKVFEVRC